MPAKKRANAKTDDSADSAATKKLKADVKDLKTDVSAAAAAGSGGAKLPAPSPVAGGAAAASPKTPGRPKVALITGVTGQDGSYLCEFLLAKVCGFTPSPALSPLTVQITDFKSM